MDQERFDRLARALGRVTTRRSGIASALGGGVAMLAGLSAPDAAAGGARRGHPKPEGPCGDGSRKDNICTKDKECCTGICDTAKGKTNKDGKGRCRCVRRGGACTDDRNCCAKSGQALVCQGGRCARPGIPTGDPCAEGDVCLDAAATCRTYFSGDPDGTFCLIGNGGACAGALDCASRLCEGGVCAAETCTVCTTGCPYSDLDSAIAAAPVTPILIDAGTWQTAAPYFANGAFLRPCNGGAVIVQGTLADGALFHDDPTNGSSLMLFDLTVTNAAADGKGVVIQGGYANVPGLVLRNVTVRDCPGGGVHVYDTATVSITGSTIENCTADTAQSTNRGGGIFANTTSTFDPSTLTISDTTIRNNTAGAAGGGIWIAKTAATFQRVTVSGNTATSAGGGIYLNGTDGATALTVTGSGTTVTGNTAPEASGIGVRATGNVTVTGVTDANVSGNLTGSDCETTPDGTSWTAVACSAL